MAGNSKELIKKTPKPKVARCDKICVYVSSSSEPQRCKNRCAKEPDHILNCKCKTHEMQ